MARILSVGYDLALLNSRQMLLESLGFEVISASDFRQALQLCQNGGGFDLFVLGHSIAWEEREVLVSAFRVHCSAPVIALKRPGEEPTTSADFQIEPEPGQLLAVIRRVVSGPAASA